MVDFIESFNAGLSAAQKAADNKAEIESVFNTLNEQLGKSTEGKVKIVILEKKNVFQEMAATINKTIRSSVQVLAAQNPKVIGGRSKDLATWSMDANGYPCMIITGDDELYCEDKAGLERSLKGLLSSPRVGEKMYAIMAQPSTPPDPDDK